METARSNRDFKSEGNKITWVSLTLMDELRYT